MTMKEVIERVRKELNDQYVPLVNKFRDEASAKDTFYRRELEKQELALVQKSMNRDQRLRTVETQLQDFIAKYNDKVKECESYIKISEHRLEQYNELMERKRDLEGTRQTVIGSMQSTIESKDRELEELRAKVHQLEFSMQLSKS